MALPYIGLTLEQVAESRRLHGANVLTQRSRKSLWERYVEKLFGDKLIVILEVAAVLSVVIAFAEYYGWAGLTPQGLRVFAEPCGILLAILLATGIAFYFEVKADKEFSLLSQARDDESVKAVRAGRVTTIARREVVVGDIVILAPGDEIPADGHILRSSQLLVDESTLTGELQSHKGLDLPHERESTYPPDHLLRGTTVMEGRATYEVTAVGDATEDGKLMHAAAIDTTVVTPLNSQLDRLGKRIAKYSYLLAALIFVGRLLTYLLQAGSDIASVDFVDYMLQSVMIVVTFIVMAVPEGLPMAVSLSLAYSMRRMLKQGSLMRRLHACETMGAASVICTDKTGTLTQNRMQVAEAVFFNREVTDADGIIAESMAVNSTAHLSDRVVGNPTEGALLLWLRDAGVDYMAVRESVVIEAELPFSTERKMMAMAVKRRDGTRRLYLKGAPEIVLDLCAAIDGNVPKQEVLIGLDKWQRSGMRTLGFAVAELADDEQPIRDKQLQAKHLHFVGYVAISDPVRSDVPAAVAECREAGIDIKIITGDTVGTATEVGRSIGIIAAAPAAGQVATGPDIAAMSDEELQQAVADLKIIARARPLDKQRVVEALQRRGEVVAVTGDGTNDAPALRAAHVGLSMGDGTAVAKEASDITILDNSFASIATAVMWGRSLYRNIQRFLIFQLTVNATACLVLLAGAAMGMQSPLTVTQMLWINLIMDSFAAVAMASLPPQRSVMKEKPRSPKASIVNRSLVNEIVLTSVIFLAALLSLQLVLEHGTAVTSFTGVLNIGVIKSALSMEYHIMEPVELSIFFTFFVMLHWWNMLAVGHYATAKGEMPIKEWRSVRTFMIIWGIILIGQLVIVELGVDLFNVKDLALWNDWLPIFVVTGIVVALSYLLRRRLWKKQRKGDAHQPNN